KRRGAFSRTSLTRRARPLTPPPLLWLAGLPQGSRVALSPARRGAPRRRPQGRRLGPHASHIDHEHGAAHEEKAELVQRIAQELGSTTAKAEAAVEAILSTIKASLQQGEPVILRRFGTWQVRGKPARVGRNPKTGAVAAIAARRVVRFTAGQPFKQAVEAATHRVE